MNVTVVVGIAMLTVVGVLLLRRYNPVYALILAMIGGSIVLGTCLSLLQHTTDFLRELSRRAGSHSEWLKLLIKAIGIGYVCRFASDMCCDAGETAIAGYVELAGKVMIVTLALPMLTQIVQTIMKLIEL